MRSGHNSFFTSEQIAADTPNGVLTWLPSPPANLNYDHLSFKYKERIVQASRLPEDDVLKMYHVFLRRINLYKEELISPANLSQAYRLCQDIDPKDSLQVALTLEINGLLWTGDKKLRTGLTRKGFTHFYDPITV